MGRLGRGTRTEGRLGPAEPGDSGHAPRAGPPALENKHLKSSDEQRGLCKTVTVVARSQMAASGSAALATPTSAHVFP